jgi:hypothetical protein
MADTAVLLGPGNVALQGPAPSVVTGDASSTVAGFLAPFASPLYDDPLDDFLHAFLVALSTLPGPFVRPRWQPEPPNLPNFATNWLAWGITDIDEDRFAYQEQISNDDEEDHLNVSRDELLTMLLSFYGPKAGQLAKQVSNSVQLGQNRSYLRAQNMTVVEVMPQIRVPALFKEKWVPRVDMRILFRRRAVSSYAVKTLEDFSVGLDNELYTTPLVAPAPT